MRVQLTLIATAVFATFAAGAPLENDYNHHAMHKRGPAVLEKAKSDLNWVFKDLKGSISEIEFDHDDFEDQVEDFRKAISNIEFRVENEPVYDGDLATKVEFVKTMYQTMVDASDKMSLYFGSDFPGNVAVYEMIELKVRALAFNNLNGQFDFDIENYHDRLARLYCKFFKLVEESKNYTKEPAFARVMGKLVYETKNVIDRMWKLSSNQPFNEGTCRG
ncbi:hypothetical protein JCM33374_g6082 [Metschnikowia sp. JCM 33374]|nr:hypothetical protein JCM33374_g6082 [Metschnikowia sp. JCM 33374]